MDDESGESMEPMEPNPSCATDCVIRARQSPTESRDKIAGVTSVSVLGLRTRMNKMPMW